jgi:hypothetical protein
VNRHTAKDALEAIGIIAIVASLVFVGFQLRQTEESLEMQFLQGETASFQDWIGRVSESAELANALAISETNPSDLTPGQRKQVRAWLEEWLSQMATWDNLQRSGVFPESALEIRVKNNCYIYSTHKAVLEEIRKDLTFGFRVTDRYCGDLKSAN